MKAFEKEQEPVITAGLAARKASREAYAAAVKAWEMRMERARATSEKTRPELRLTICRGLLPNVVGT